MTCSSQIFGCQGSTQLQVIARENRLIKKQFPFYFASFYSYLFRTHRKITPSCFTPFLRPAFWRKKNQRDTDRLFILLALDFRTLPAGAGLGLLGEQQSPKIGVGFQGGLTKSKLVFFPTHAYTTLSKQ